MPGRGPNSHKSIINQQSIMKKQFLSFKQRNLLRLKTPIRISGACNIDNKSYFPGKEEMYQFEIKLLGTIQIKIYLQYCNSNYLNNLKSYPVKTGYQI